MGITCKFEKKTAQEEECCLVLPQACNRWPRSQWSALVFFQHLVGTPKPIRQVGTGANSLCPISRPAGMHRRVRPSGLSGRPPRQPAAHEDRALCVGQVTRPGSHWRAQRDTARQRQPVARPRTTGPGSRVRADTPGQGQTLVFWAGSQTPLRLTLHLQNVPCKLLWGWNEIVHLQPGR